MNPLIRVIKNIALQLSPPFLSNWARKMFLKPAVLPVDDVSFSGRYKSWQEALREAEGYDDSRILERVSTAAQTVRDGKALFERDSVLFHTPDYNWPLLSALLFVMAESSGNLNLIDFGGSLGSTYFQNRSLLKQIGTVRWNIVEQENFVELGKAQFQNEELFFSPSLEAALASAPAKVILVSSTLQYLEDPFGVIETIISKGFTYIILDHLAFVEGSEEIITLQNTPSSIYKASYPAWFFNYPRFVERLEKDYIVIFDFNSHINPCRDVNGKKGYWKGMLLRKKAIKQNEK